MRYFVVPSFRLFFQSILPLLFAMVAVSLQAQKLSVQGLLKKGDGTSLPDGNYTMKFNFYDTNGNFVAAVTTNDVPVSGGVYSALLDASSATPSNTLNFSTEYLVGLVVNGGTELTPRITMSAAPYALALNGSSNKFPSFGTVKADAMDVAGAVAAASVTATGNVSANRALANTGTVGGYVFNGTTGSNDGVISPTDNEVSIYTNGSERLKVSNTSTTVNGNQTVTGNLTVNGTVFSDNKIVTNSANGGFSFSADGAYDTGLFSGGVDGRCEIKSNTTTVAKFSTSEVVVENVSFAKIASNGDVQLAGISGGNPTSISLGGAISLNLGPANNNNGHLYINGVKPKGTTGNARNIAIDLSNGRVFEESSSRRYKKNIRPLQENFSLLLKAQPRIYNRYEDPADIDTAKYFEIGYIAEEIDSIGLRRVVQYNNEGQIDGVDYTKMILYAVEVLKMQHADIEKLKAEVAALTSEKNALRTENAQLRADAQKRAADTDKQMTEINRRLRSLEVAASNRK